MGRPFNKSGGGRGRGGGVGRGRGGGVGRGRGGRGRGGGGSDRGRGVTGDRGSRGRGGGVSEKRSFNSNQVAKQKSGAFLEASFNKSAKTGNKKSDSNMSFKIRKQNQDAGSKKSFSSLHNGSSDDDDEDEMADMSVDIDSSNDGDSASEEIESGDENKDSLASIVKNKSSSKINSKNSQVKISSDSDQSEDDSDEAMDESFDEDDVSGSEDDDDVSVSDKDDDDDDGCSDDLSKACDQSASDANELINNKTKLKPSSTTFSNQKQGATVSSVAPEIDKKKLLAPKVDTNENVARKDDKKKNNKTSAQVQPASSVKEPASEEERAALNAKAFALAQQLASQVLFIKPIPRHCSLSQLRQFCREASNVRIPLHESTGRNRGYAFADFKSREQAERVRLSIHGKLLGGKSVEAHLAGGGGQRPRVSTPDDYNLQCLFITGLARDVSKTELHDLYPAANRIEMKTTNDKRSVGHCLVSFNSVAIAMAALQDTQHRQVKGQGISVTFSKKRHTETGVVQKPNLASSEQTRGHKRTASSTSTNDAKKTPLSTNNDAQKVSSSEKLSVKRKALELSEEEYNRTSKKAAIASRVATPLFSSEKKNGKRQSLSTASKLASPIST